jgi:DNA polymerase/3'-5' exonuclease PolX
MIQEHRDTSNSNAFVAEALGEAANLLAQQGASQFKVAAYRNASQFIKDYPGDIAEVVNQGNKALEDLPHIGPTIASAIIQLTSTGRWPQLERMRGTLDPEIAFQGIPGIGPSFARLIHEHLHVDTLEALESAAHDGRLASVPGIGDRRVKIIQNALASILSRRRPPLSPSSRTPPSIRLLLSVDEEYRTKAKAGQLKLIAPKRFNPASRAWLPVLHTERDHWHFTAFFSNTARAHELGKTADWVVIYYASDHKPEDQCTVVTETKGPLKGKRVVRGREKESLQELEELTDG